MAKTQVYQTGTINSLLQAVYEGDVTADQLCQHGDLGLGAFDAIDGEMIVYDGICYRANHEGSINQVAANQKSPFAMVCQFKADYCFSVEKLSLAALEQVILARLPSANLIYAFRIHGHFQQLALRSEQCTSRPYQKLTTILPNLQREFTCIDQSGVLVGMWFPQYLASLNVPGFHFHFLNQERTRGGHVFGFELTAAQVEIQILHGLNLELIASNDFYQAELTQVSQSEVAQVEQVRS